jgi:hypothetical protein
MKENLIRSTVSPVWTAQPSVGLSLRKMAHPSVAVDAPYVQRGIGPTPFSSVRSPASDPEPHLITRTDAIMQAHSQGTRIAFNARKVGLAPECNSAWVFPPPTVSAISRVEPKPHVAPDAAPPLPKDTLHPLISAMQAAENAKAVSLNPAVAIMSNAARNGPPCDAHAALARRQGVSRDTGAADQSIENDSLAGGGEQEGNEDGEEGGDYNGVAATRVTSMRHTRRGDIKTAVGRAYNAEGAFHEPEQYSMRVVDFASSQPQSSTAIAAKALASALHDRSSTAIPSIASHHANFRPKPNSSVHGPSVNRNLHAGLFGQRDGVIPPSPAFRALPEHVRALLVNRPVDSRSAVENFVRSPEDALHALETLPTTNEDAETIDELVMRGGAGDLWQDALTRCGARQQTSSLPMPSSHPLGKTLAARRFRVVNPQLVSLYTSQSTRPQLSALLGGCGLRMDDALTQVTLPSEASFLSDPARAKAVKQYTNIPYTPTNAYGFDSQRFSTLLNENGLEVEEIQMEGAFQIDTLGDIAVHCPNVKILHLGGCPQLSPAIVAAITKNCKKLAFINVSNADLSNESVNGLLSNASNLMTFCMNGNPRVDSGADLGFGMLHKHRHLRVLDISYCPKITDIALAALAQFCPSVEVLDISGCFGITDLGVNAVGASCTALRAWRLALCCGVSAEGLAGLACAPRNLEVLDVSGCTALTNAAVDQLARRLSSVQYLSIAGCTKVDDAAVQSVARHCRKLKVLNLSSCVGITLNSCMELIHELPNLARLVVSESSISNAEVVMLSSLRETCEIVRNQFRPVAPRTLIGFRAPEVKKAPKTDAKKQGKK